MKRKTIINQLRKTEKEQHDIDFILTIITIVNTICYIIVVKINHNILGNLSIDLMSKILSFIDRFQHTIKF